MTKDFSYGIIPYQRTTDGPLFLMIQHSAGHWSFPKGHKEGDETDLEAAQRELREETGIAHATIDSSTSFIEHYTWNRDGEIIDKNVIFFLGEVPVSEVTIQAEEIQDYAWLPFVEATEKLTHAETQEVLQNAYTYLTKNA